MRKTIIYLLLIMTISGCSTLKKMSNDSSSKVSFKEFGYGICETKSVYNEEMENSPSRNHTLSTRFTLIQQTDRVPGKIGQKFGIEYKIKSNITRDILVEQVWIFPKPITDEKGKEFKELRYKMEKSTNDKTFSTYVMEKDYEVVKGEWTYQMFCDGDKIYERKFYVE